MDRPPLHFSTVVYTFGYATDMCYCRSMAGYDNRARDFRVFLIGDATRAGSTANATPRFGTNVAASFASLGHQVLQGFWVEYRPAAWEGR